MKYTWPIFQSKLSCFCFANRFLKEFYGPTSHEYWWAKPNFLHTGWSKSSSLSTFDAPGGTNFSGQVKQSVKDRVGMTKSGDKDRPCEFNDREISAKKFMNILDDLAFESKKLPKLIRNWMYIDLSLNFLPTWSDVRVRPRHISREAPNS